jgi:hypothetical protein
LIMWTTDWLSMLKRQSNLFNHFGNCIIYKILGPPLYMICYSTLHTCLTQACQATNKGERLN